MPDTLTVAVPPLYGTDTDPAVAPGTLGENSTIRVHDFLGDTV